METQMMLPGVCLHCVCVWGREITNTQGHTGTMRQDVAGQKQVKWVFETAGVSFTPSRNLQLSESVTSWVLVYRCIGAPPSYQSPGPAAEWGRSLWSSRGCLHKAAPHTHPSSWCWLPHWPAARNTNRLPHSHWPKKELHFLAAKEVDTVVSNWTLDTIDVRKKKDSFWLLRITIIPQNMNNQYKPQIPSTISLRI